MILATPLPSLKRLLPEGASVHFERLLGHDPKHKRLRWIKACPKRVLHLEDQVAHAPVAGISLLDVHDRAGFGTGFLLVEAKRFVLAPGGEVFGDDEDLLVGRTVVLLGAGRVDADR